MLNSTEYASLRIRAEMLEAQLNAANDCVDIVILLSEVDDPEIAARVLKERYQLSDVQAEAVLGLQLRRVTRHMRELLSTEMKDVRARLASQDATPL